ncbi:DNA alkylation repair protein [Adhaeribacter aquaticus]|uniref:DNA alkylation repair protein n=1 Tax=Adhaeribacter aquaticus TaxID=299567 RepID=UPI00040CC193|nr:DNA alkylation repair protein [Adhaeribacter aquaticus]
MSTLLKDIYSPAFFTQFSDTLKRVIPDLNKEQFWTLLFDAQWEARELKERMRHVATVMHEFLPADFPAAVMLLEKLIQELLAAGHKPNSLEYMFLPDYLEQYGLESFDAAVQAMEKITQFTSCEFAVRPFLLQYPELMIAQMQAWALHEHPNVRRLASEGMRPRLPWAMAIPALKKDPSPILPILELLKNDPSEFVRRSVANNLNDIAKDHPEVVLSIAHKWKGVSPETDKIIKHGCRTLLKQGHPEILSYFKLQNLEALSLTNFKIHTEEVKLGSDLIFSFSVQNNHQDSQRVRLEYSLYYNKANGQLARKVFKISEKAYQPSEMVKVTRKQSFKYITTRKFYPGQHRLSVILNGQEKAIADFLLVE